MRLRQRHPRNGPTGEDFPISPLLDLTLFVYLYVIYLVSLPFLVEMKSRSEEGRLPLKLSPADSDPIPLQTRYIVRVTANRGGAIANIAVRDEAAAGWTDLGTDHRALIEELNRRSAGQGKLPYGLFPPKLTIEIGGKLLQAYVVQILDVAIQAGFADVALVPIDPADR